MEQLIFWLIGAFFLFQLVSFSFIFWCMVEIKSMQKSTHSIQYVPADSHFQSMTDEVKSALNKDIFENVT